MRKYLTFSLKEQWLKSTLATEKKEKYLIMY